VRARNLVGGQVSIPEVTLRSMGVAAAILGAVAFLLHVGVVLRRFGLRHQWTQTACAEWRRTAAKISRRTASVSGQTNVLENALTRPEMKWLRYARAWLAEHPTQARELVPSLADPVFVGLTEASDVYMNARDQPPFSRGYFESGALFATSEDLFSRAGRASWLLHEVTGRSDEPGVPRGTTRIALAKRIKSWSEWFRALDGGRACFPAR
jgi:hypothetical protein